MAERSNGYLYQHIIFVEILPRRGDLMDFVRLFELPMIVSILQTNQLLPVINKVGYLNHLRSKHLFGNLKGHSWINLNSTQGVEK